MTQPEQADAPRTEADASLALSDRSLGWILVLLAGSGCAALIYEIVWFQQLQLVIGSTALSLGLLLATYMGGLFLGSVLLGQIISARHHPLRLYAALELGIGVSGVLILFGLPYVGRFYVAGAAEGLPGLVLRGLMCAACLLPPTILMGATFPVVSRWIKLTKSGVSRIGLFYGANIAGAVAGCLFAGFYLLRVHDLLVATYVAVAMNLVVAVAGFALATWTRYHPPPDTVSAYHAPGVRGPNAIYIATALSGLCALGAQVVWTRLLAVLLGATVYTFSIILAVFLIGLGSGSGIGSLLARWIGRPRLALGVCQMLLAAAIAWTAWTIAKSLPYWPIDPTLALSPWFNFQVDLLRTLWTILPATLLWGASFPLALAALASPEQDPGRLAGLAYGANTFGAIVGAVGFSFVFIPRIGTLHAQQVLIGLSLVAALIMLTPLGRPSLPNGLYGEPFIGKRGMASLVASVVLALALIGTVSEVPWQVIAYGRRTALMMGTGLGGGERDSINVLYRGEGLNSSLVITEQSGQRIIYVNGNVEASTDPDDMRLQRIAGHIPALVHPEPRDVLVVGFGAGTTAGTFVTHPQVENIVIVELEALIPPASGRFFERENYGVLDDERTRIIYDDGRHYLLTSDEKFDVITSDPVHLWVKGTSALYSKEYFELVRGHLSPGGVAAQWLPLYDGDVNTVKSVLATFFEVFPSGTVWTNIIGNRGFDLVLLGQTAPTRINVDAFLQRLSRPDHAAVVTSLGSVGFNTGVDVLTAYLGQASDLRPWLMDAQINLDRNMRLQYLAGFEINRRVPSRVYQDLRAYRRFPDGVFVGSDRFIQLLRAVF